ncbi:hypothetical protein [Saccharicrinis sp. FJH54]|uniref:hypothetical protein n=1 Tax=Saccharicrinis sp. FJH54 TaxID=3344665 RepID=UPI0035D44DB2
MKNIGLIFIGLIISMISYSQDKLWQIDKEVSEYYTDTLYSQIDLRYSNSTDSALVLWIEKYNVDSISDSKKIKNHFFTRKGDWSLIQIILDGNVSSFVPGLFDSFMKVVKPGDQFTVSILSKGKTSSDLISSLEKHIVIVKAGDIKGLQIDDSIDMFNFKANNVIILADWIK